MLFIVVSEGEVFLHVDFTGDTELLFSLLYSCSIKQARQESRSGVGQFITNICLCADQGEDSMLLGRNAI